MWGEMGDGMVGKTGGGKRETESGASPVSRLPTIHLFSFLYR